MAWPKKKTRKIVVDGTPFLWHYSAGCLYCSDAVITVGKEDDRFYLFIDPYPHDFEFRPAKIADAIRWAIAEGWTSANGPTRGMAYDSTLGSNVWLPQGARHLCDVNPAAR